MKSLLAVAGVVTLVKSSPLFRIISLSVVINN